MPVRHKSTFLKIVEKVEKLNRRAERRGLAPAFMITVEREFSNKKPGTYLVETFVDFQIKGDFPAISGYTFAAIVDHASGGLVFRNPDFTEEVDLRSFADRNVCDHCGTNRRRSKTILLSDRNGKILQVGTSCIIDFLGESAKSLELFVENLEDLVNMEDEPGDPGAKGSHIRYNTVEVCAIAAKLISDLGFVKSCTPGATSSMISAFVHERIAAFPRAYDFTVTEVHMEQARQVIDFISQSERKNDYQENLFRIVTSERCDENMFGFIAAGVRGALADIRRSKEKERNKDIEVPVESFPAVGMTITDIDVTIEKLFTFESLYGTQRLIIMKNAANIPFVWKTSTFPDVEEGASYTIKKAKVKAHDTYKGVMQCRIERVVFKKD